MVPLASLPMYDLPEVSLHTDGLWSFISADLAATGIDAPSVLTRQFVSLKDHWLDPSLVISHSCGYPVVTDLLDRVEVVGSWSTVVDLEDKPGWYRAVIVAREADHQADDLCAYSRSGLRLCANGPDSLSGWVSLAHFLHEQSGLSDSLLSNEVPVLITGGHFNSVEAVRSGRADVASIDAWSFWLLSTWRRQAAAGLRVIGFGPEVAVTPIITHLGGPVESLQNTLQRAASNEDLTPSLAALGITGFVSHGREVHDPVRLIADRYEPTVGLLRRQSW
jgi:ABC-type phosphate/phosphonate transport system substrate-binding protein